MDEYISRKEAIAYIREQSEECQKAFEEFGGESGIYADAYNDLEENFYSIPAADVAQVVHGRWVRHTMIPYFANCSVCKDAYVDEEWLRDGKWGYCPNCGAKMDGGDNNAAD